MARATARRVGRIAARVLAGLVGLVVTLVVVVVVSLDLPPVRELVRVRVNRELESALTGKLTLERIGHVGLGGVAEVDATMRDMGGRRVAIAQGLEVETFWPRIVWSALTGDGVIDIQIEAVSLRNADIALIDDGTGRPTLATAFEPKPAPPTPGPGTGVRIVIARIQADHAWIHGRLGDGLALDGDIRTLEGGLRFDAKGLSSTLERTGIAFRALPQGLDPVGTLSARFDVPNGSGPRGSARFVGTLAGARAVADGAWDGTALHALLRAPGVPPEVFAERVPGLRIREPMSLYVSVDGKPSELRFDGELAGRAVRLDVRGHASMGEETVLSAVADAEDADLSGIVSGAPSSTLSAHADLALIVASSGALHGDYRVEVLPGRVRALSTPGLRTAGRLQKPHDGELTVDGRLTVDEPGLPMEVRYGVRVKSDDVRAHAELDASFREPPRLASLGVRASGKLFASGDFDSRESSLDVKAKLRLTSLRHDAVRARALALDAKLAGRTSEPRLRAELTAGPVEALGRRFTAVSMTAVGEPSQLDVHALLLGASPERIELETRVSVADALELDGTRIALRGPEGSLELAATKVRVSSERTSVEGISFRGAGQADGSLELLPQRQRVELAASDLELGRIARLAGIPVPFERALVSADVSLAREHGIVTGSLKARAANVRIGKLENASTSLDLVFTPRDVSGTADADFGEGGRFHAELERFELPRAPWTLERLARQPGSVVARGDLQLAGFFPLIEATGLPIERIFGTVRFDVRASGGEGALGPRLEARVETKDLRIIERRPHEGAIKSTSAARKVEPRALEDIDVRALVAVDPDEHVLRADLQLFDPYGTLVSLNGEARLPPDWPRALAKSWRALPLRATLDVPRRPLEIFPAVVRPAAEKGVASAHFELEGSVSEPKLAGEVVLDRLRVRRADEPLSVEATAHYETAKGSLSLAADARGRRVGTVEAAWRGDAAALARVRAGSQSPILLDASAELSDFPLESIPALADRQIRGPLSGTIRLEDLGRDAKLEVKLDGSKMAIDQVRMARLRAEVVASAGVVRAKVEAGDKKGSANLELETDAPWGARLIPTVPTRAEGRLQAHDFRLASLNPALMQYLNEVGGRLDADLRVRLEPGRTELTGQASVRDGVVQIPAVGQRFTDVRGRVRIDGDRVVIDDVVARGPTGRLRAHASARLDGMTLLSAEAHVAISEREKLPLTLQGAALGDAWGRADVEYEGAPGGATALRVDVPSFHVELAEDGDLEVQSLDDVESIRIGAVLADGTFTALAVQPLESGGDDTSEENSPMRVRVRLGRDVVIERGRALKVQLGGEVLMKSNGESRVTGRLELHGGTLDVQGKLFDIERGLVVFNGDPSNPTITATARWDSPAGYTVYADYRGDVEDGKIVLHSEPPLTQDEIASLILFGTPDGTSGSGSSDPNAAATAVGVAGDTAARGVNRALSDLTKLDVAARVDTSTGSARPELVVALTPRIAARVTRAVGEPQAGQPPDRTFLTVEFRFTRSWSVSAIVGDHGGSGMDVIWRRRY